MRGAGVQVTGIDAVLLAAPPTHRGDEAVHIAKAMFDIDAAGARDLGSERDQAFMLLDHSGEGLAVLKVSNTAEDPAVLDMEALAAQRAVAVDPGLLVAQPWQVPGATGDDPIAYRARWGSGDATHWVRMYDVLPGLARIDARTLEDSALGGWGETAARLGRALRGFAHPQAIRRMPWDVQHASTCRPMLASIRDVAARSAVEAVLDRFDAVVAPRWAALRAQVIHGDFTVDNALTDEHGFPSGIIDFGDLSHTALIVDLASLLDSVCADRTGDEVFRAARLVLDGYQRCTQLEQTELDLMVDLWAARSAVTVAIGAWRAEQGLEDMDFAERYSASALGFIDEVRSRGWSASARELGGVGDEAPDYGAQRLVERRAAALGPALEPLSYATPIDAVAASGVWITDTAGRRYLDAYNNVVALGHTHPRVVTAVARQWRVLNTNMRYLHPSAVELAERLVATSTTGLDTVLFVNSGSEANDLAWRLATHHTGNTGVLCTDFAYHGITDITAQMSPETLSSEMVRPFVARWLPPDAYRGRNLDTSGFVTAIAALHDLGLAPAAAILDGVLQSDGVLDLAPEYVQELVRLTHEAGGLWIADEVQGGHGRTGDALWSYSRFGIEPDFVTLGKPMGNGQPVGAVITRRELVERFARDSVFFSTFGGNQVSMAASHAVLDVIDDERILARVLDTGLALRSAVREATADDQRVGDVRGMGLANGIEIVSDSATRAPDGRTAKALKEALRDNGVLVGTAGRFGNVLKVRPPLAFTVDHVPLFVTALRTSLATTAPVT